MATFDYAYNFTLPNETYMDENRIYDDNDDSFDQKQHDGTIKHIEARAIAGINSHYWPDQYAECLAIPRLERGPYLKTFYEKYFWNRWLEGIVSEDIAARVFDSGFNQGQGIACKLIQHSVNALQSTQIEADGKWGPVTLAAVNNLNPIQLLNKFRDMRAAQYRVTGNDALVPRALK